MPKAKNAIYIALFLVLVLVVWAGLALLPGPKSAQLPAGEQGGYDLTDYDFTDSIYVATSVWDSWPEKLYTPEELDDAEAPVSQQSIDYTSVEYATYRLRLALRPARSMAFR